MNAKGRSKWERPGNKPILRVKLTVPGAFVHKLQHVHLFARSLKPKTLKVPLKVYTIHQNWYAQNFWVPKANLVNYDLAKIVQTGIYQCTELLALYPVSSSRSLGTRLLSYNIHLKYQQLMWYLRTRPTSASIIPYSNPTSILPTLPWQPFVWSVWRFIDLLYKKLSWQGTC